jgi:hypothetical protein
MLDLFVRYNHCSIDIASRDLTTVQSPIGVVRLTHLLQGWTNMVTIFHDDVTFVLEPEIPCYAQVLSVAYSDFVSAFDEQGRCASARHGLLCQSCRIMDVVTAPPSLSEEGVGGRGVSDLVLTQENKPKARPKSKHKLIYMGVCELPPILGFSPTLLSSKGIRPSYHNRQSSKGTKPVSVVQSRKERKATLAYQGRVGQRAVEALTWRCRHCVVIGHRPSGNLRGFVGLEAKWDLVCYRHRRIVGRTLLARQAVKAPL